MAITRHTIAPGDEIRVGNEVFAVIRQHGGDNFYLSPVPTQEFKPLTDRQWDLLAKCEAPFYQPFAGGHAWTDVMTNDGDPFLRAIWDHTWASVEATEVCESSDHIDRETARRVAAVLAIMAFGKDILLK